jgi:hypothetical protein
METGEQQDFAILLTLHPDVNGESVFAVKLSSQGRSLKMRRLKTRVQSAVVAAIALMRPAGPSLRSR